MSTQDPNSSNAPAPSNSQPIAPTLRIEATGFPKSDWRTDPSAWLRESIAIELERMGSPDSYDARPIVCKALLADGGPVAHVEQLMGENSHGIATMESLEHLARLFRTVRQDYYRTGQGKGGYFLAHGPMALPVDPRTVRILYRLKDLAYELTAGGAGKSKASKSNSTWATMMRQLHTASDQSAMIQSAWEAGPSEKDLKGARAHVNLSPRMVSMLPARFVKGHSWLAPQLEGMEMDEDQLRELMDDAGFCQEGTIQFLESHGIYPETSGGEYECGECGTTQNQEEERELESCPDFTWDSSMLEELDRRDLLEHLRDWASESEDASSTWSELLEETPDDAELAAHLAPRFADLPKDAAPDAKRQPIGTQYDPEFWEFVPDLESQDMEELEASEMLRLLPIFTRALDAWTSAGVLPPIDGILKAREGQGIPKGESSVWQWTWADAQLMHYATPDLRVLAYSAKNHTANKDRADLGLSMRHDGRWQGIAMQQNGTLRDAFTIRINANEKNVGERCALWTAILQGDLSL